MAHHRALQLFYRGVTLRLIPLTGFVWLSAIMTLGAAPPESSPQSVVFEFADLATSRTLLAKEDTYTKALSPFDRKVRMGLQEDPGTRAHLNFMADQAQAWSAKPKEAVEAAIKALQDPLLSLGIRLKQPIRLIHTTGREESGAAYTRGSEIMLPPQETGSLKKPPTRLVAHELFHVISRQHPRLRDQLYALIGFKKANPINLPSNLAHLKITNPDAPIIEHVIQLKLSPEQTVTVAPVLIAKHDFRADRQKGLFGYLSFKLMQVSQTPDGWEPALAEDGPLYHSPQTPDFARQIGRNTGYIIHPEEILADNFSLLVTDGNITDRWLTDQIRDTLTTYFAKTTETN